MKKVIIIIVAATLLFSCKKKVNNNDNVQVYPMSADINGVAFNGTNCRAHFYSSANLEITGGFFPDSSITYPYIDLGIVGYTGVGNYILIPPPLKYYGCTAEIDSAYGHYVKAYSGAITVTSVSPNIAGTFSFTTTQGITVTNGSFSVKAP